MQQAVSPAGKQSALDFATLPQTHQTLNHQNNMRVGSSSASKQFKASPVKHSISSEIEKGAFSKGSDLASSVGADADPRKVFAIAQNRSDTNNALASQLFSSSDEEQHYEEDPYVANEPYVVGDDEEGDGDSDFEPAEQSIRGATYHLGLPNYQSNGIGLDFYDLGQSNINVSS
jgi:hypothetical protein